MNNYFIVQDVEFKSLYDFSTSIVDIQKNNNYFELSLLEWLAIFNGIDSNMLPPMGSSEFRETPSTYWSETNVKKLVQQVLTSYVPFLQVYGTFNYQDIGSDNISNSLYTNGMTLYTPNPNFQYSVEFYYLDWWPIYFDLNCNGDLCKAESISTLFDLIPLIGFHEYDFLYDVSYPVMVEVTDERAYNGDGLVMRFLIESNLRNNLPVNTTVLNLNLTQRYSSNTMFCVILISV